jgi:hypothetical protein
MDKQIAAENGFACAIEFRWLSAESRIESMRKNLLFPIVPVVRKMMRL